MQQQLQQQQQELQHRDADGNLLRVRRACVECHDRKLACSVGRGPEGTRCDSCITKCLPCTRVRRRAGPSTRVRAGARTAVDARARPLTRVP